MTNTPFLRTILTALTLALSVGCTTVSDLVESDRENEVVFYNTFGYQEGDEWIIPMRIHVHHSRDRVENWTAAVAGWRYDPNEEEEQIFRTRIDDFVSDSESREDVEFVFVDDPHERIYRIQDQDGDFPRTDLNGHKEGFITLSKSRADSLLQFQNSENGWLTIRATSDHHNGTGAIQLIWPQGLSVISDIDDTVKITELPGGSDIVIQNTFFKEFTAAPGMAELYNNWEDAVFHYVSGAPWQLYQPLSTFLFDDEQGFPRGSFHMKSVRTNLFNIDSWRDLGRLITSEEVTYEQKFGQIEELISTFPYREFILVGDSGEKDPEIYSSIRKQFPDQIKEIIIRDVINDRELNPERLAGMTIIPAETIQPGVSQFH